MTELKIEIKGNLVLLSGILDETSDLSSLKNTPDEIVIDFNGITRVNSGGVREWILSLGQIASKKITYRNCPIVIVKQLNAVPSFLGSANVESLYAPYYCPSCEQDDNRLIKITDVQQGQPPHLECQTCKKKLEFDSIAAQYFSFIKKP